MNTTYTGTATVGYCPSTKPANRSMAVATIDSVVSKKKEWKPIERIDVTSNEFYRTLENNVELYGGMVEQVGLGYYDGLMQKRENELFVTFGWITILLEDKLGESQFGPLKEKFLQYVKAQNTPYLRTDTIITPPPQPQTQS